MDDGPLIKRKRLESNPREQLVLIALASAPVALSSEEISELTGIASGVVRRITRQRLEPRGLVARRGERGPFCLTDAGRAEAGANVPGTDLTPALNFAIGHFPAEPLRAMTRILVSLVAARHHLIQERPGGWGGAIALGPSKGGKTSLGRFICRLYGLEERLSIRLVQGETEGSLYGRRRQREGGRMSFEPSPLIGLDFVCLDELDKAGERQRSEALRLLHDDAQMIHEGVEVLVRPTCLITLNTDRRGLSILPASYRRRAVVLDFTPLGPLLGDVDLAMERLFAPGVIPHLELEELRPPASQLPAALRRRFRDVLRQGLTDPGWELADAEILSRAVLGRAAIAGDGDLERAALATAFDYQATAATLGETRPDFAQKLGPILGREALGTDPTAVVKELARAAEMTSARRQGKARERYVFQADRERQRAKLIELAGRLGTSHDPEVRSLGKVLRLASKDVAACRTSEALSESVASISDYVLDARRLLSRRASDAAEQQRRKEQEQHDRGEQAKQRRQAAANRKTANARQKRIAAEGAKHERALRALAARVGSHTRANEDVLGRLFGAGCISGAVIEYWEQAPSLLDLLASSLQIATKELALRSHRRGQKIPASSPTKPTPNYPPLPPPREHVRAAPPPAGTRRYDLKERIVWRGRDGRLYETEELRRWDSPKVSSVIQAAAKTAGIDLLRPAYG